MSSVAAHFAAHITSAYCMSKAAVYSFSESLRRELRKWQIKVVIIEPGSFKTDFTSATNLENIIKNCWSLTHDNVKQIYGQQYLDAAIQTFSDMSFIFKPIDQCVDDICRAVCSANPRLKYTPHGHWIISVIMFLNALLPIELMDKIEYITNLESKPQSS